MTLTDERTQAGVDVDTQLDVRPLSAAIGSEIHGVDLRDLTDEQVAAIRTIWLDRKVVFFPGQDLDPVSHLEFARRFGEPTEGHPVIPGLDDHPQVFEIDYSLAGKLGELYGDVKTDKGLDWHTDVTFVARPPLGSILRAVEVPEAGGDTSFSNQAAAFAGLSESLQEYLRTLTAVHDGTTQFQAIFDFVGEGKWEGKTLEKLEPSVHPVVRVHPETGEEILFVNPGFTSHIAELTRRESDALLALLYAHAVRPEFTVRYHWTPGTIAFWDNRATQHAVAGDYGNHHRVIQRVTLRGDEPVGVRP
jgi:alpha-ketoglutarate-dependent taurine dioxygenase